MSNHTPGPWTTSTVIPERVIGSGAVVLATAHTKFYPRNLGCGPDIEESRANARLMAAAPDLLRELKDARQKLWFLLDGDEEGNRSTAEAETADIDAAIAKAEVTR